MRLEIQNLTKVYGSKKALDNFSLDLDCGIYGILGPNGAGKSTLMQILTGNLKSTSGRILYDGTDIDKLGAEFRRQIGYMPQEQVYYPGFTVLSYLLYMALLKGLPIKSAEIKKQIDDLLAAVHLTDARNRKMSALSGGMKRRAILAQALLGNPSILILDEPTAGLDPRERIAMRNMIARMSGDKIVLLATHIASDIECTANHVIIMKNGRLVIQDSPLALIEQVRPFVKTEICEDEELVSLHETERVGNYLQTREGLVVHVFTDTAQEASLQADIISLDEVYLYFCEYQREGQVIL